MIHNHFETLTRTVSLAQFYVSMTSFGVGSRKLHVIVLAGTRLFVTITKVYVAFRRWGYSSVPDKAAT